jgi:hypothetical protein
MYPSDNGKLESKPMNARADLETINRFARVIEDREARRLNIPVIEARERIAIRLGIKTSALENYRRLRAKIVPNWVMHNIRAEFIAVLQSEIQRLEHEIHLARQTGADHRDNLLASAEAQLYAARQVFDEAVK